MHRVVGVVCTFGGTGLVFVHSSWLLTLLIVAALVQRGKGTSLDPTQEEAVVGPELGACTWFLSQLLLGPLGWLLLRRMRVSCSQRQESDGQQGSAGGTWSASALVHSFNGVLVVAVHWSRGVCVCVCD